MAFFPVLISAPGPLHMLFALPSRYFSSFFIWLFARHSGLSSNTLFSEKPPLTRSSKLSRVTSLSHPVFYLLYSPYHCITLFVHSYLFKTYFLKAYHVLGTELGSDKTNLPMPWSLQDEMGRQMMKKLCIS